MENWSGPAYMEKEEVYTYFTLAISGGWRWFYIAPDKKNPRFGYGTSQNGDLYRYDKLSGYYQNVSPQTKISKPFKIQLECWFCEKSIFRKWCILRIPIRAWKSNDKGANWEIISPDLTTNNPKYQKLDYGGLTLDISGAENYCSILSVAPSH